MFNTKLSSGFTIVELLVVIVVIAVLAAISIVSYSGIQQRAAASAIASDLKTNMTRIHLYQSDNGKLPTNPELWALPVADDMRMTISKKSIYKNMTYTQVATGWGQPTSDIILSGTTSSGKVFAMAFSEGVYRDLTDAVAGGATICSLVVPGKQCVGGDSILHDNGNVGRLVVKAL